jgi:hypothetical protein
VTSNAASALLAGSAKAPTCVAIDAICAPLVEYQLSLAPITVGPLNSCFTARPAASWFSPCLTNRSGSFPELAHLINTPAALDPRCLAMDPTIARMRADPRFEPLMATMQIPIPIADGSERRTTSYSRSRHAALLAYPAGRAVRR